MIDPSLHIIKDPTFHSGDCEASLDADLLDTLRWLLAHNVHNKCPHDVWIIFFWQSKVRASSAELNMVLQSFFWILNSAD